MLIVLPLPPRSLSPNARGHWAPKARAVKEYRTRAWAEAIASMARDGRRRLDWERAEARATFYVPDNRRRDPTNLSASLKAAWDGFVDAHVMTDDQYLRELPPVVVVDRRWPRVEIEITEAA